MGSLNNIFSLVFGINLILVGAVAVITGVVSLARKDENIKKTTSIIYIIAGVMAVSFGVILSIG
jgi:hypothetical membrane protein